MDGGNGDNAGAIIGRDEARQSQSSASKSNEAKQSQASTTKSNNPESVIASEARQSQSSTTKSNNPGTVIASEARQSQSSALYNDVPGFCKSATLEEIAKNDYVLTPGRYVGAAEVEDDGIPFEVKMKELSQTLFQQMKEAEELDKTIRKNLEVLGYGE